MIVRVKGRMQEMVWIKPDKPESMLNAEGQAQYVERVLYGGSVCKGGLG